MKRPVGLVLLLLALLLPLQGYAFAASCESAGAASQAPHCADHPDKPVAGAHHGCGACCMAISTAPAPILTGRVMSTAVPPRPPLAAHPLLFRDRLDRPPRD